MKEIKPINSEEKDSQWYPVESEDGVLRCSCGRELVKLDEDTWACSFGYPKYRFSEGSIILDKFGNIMLKKLKHKNYGEE